MRKEQPTRVTRRLGNEVSLTNQADEKGKGKVSPGVPAGAEHRGAFDVPE